MEKNNIADMLDSKWKSIKQTIYSLLGNKTKKLKKL